VLFGIIMSILWAPHIGSFLIKPLTAMFDGGDIAPDPQPLYSIAISRRKLGKYEEAMAEIRKQLEQFPNDFTGQLMLAEIKAENLNDLPGAQIAIQRICNQKGHSPPSISAALMQLADWQIRYWQDPDAARESLEQIRALFPGTELAHNAAQRIAHLGTRAEMVAAQNRSPIQLPVGVEDVGLAGTDLSKVTPPVDDPAAQAAEYIVHLEQHPLDADVREKLAMIYASHYQRVDYAIEQLEIIIQQPGLPTRQIVRLISVMADVHIKFGNDYEGARQCLQRIIDNYPKAASAEAARQRLDHLKLELRGHKENQAVTMGTYDQDIGLKKGMPGSASRPSK
jgi:tetratricopeptide (TPR) repeat protein